MITINTPLSPLMQSYVLTPTIFPDNTSQIWKIPEGILGSSVYIVWNFENEREIIDLYSFVKLLRAHARNIKMCLSIPYLPYARQDKPPGIDNTFNLYVFAELINNLKFNIVRAVDVHNPDLTKNLINNFYNITYNEYLPLILKDKDFDFIVFPDEGAHMRYFEETVYFSPEQVLTGSKTRDSSNGDIVEYKLNIDALPDHCKILIRDDICDGGATFVKLSHEIHKLSPTTEISLYVTHGIFSKGKKLLHEAGISKIYTTNSLLKNTEGFKV